MYHKLKTIYDTYNTTIWLSFESKRIDFGEQTNV